MKFRLQRIRKISFIDSINCQNHVKRMHKFGSHLQENTPQICYKEQLML